MPNKQRATGNPRLPGTNRADFMRAATQEVGQVFGYQRQCIQACALLAAVAAAASIKTEPRAVALAARYNGIAVFLGPRARTVWAGETAGLEMQEEPNDPEWGDAEAAHLVLYTSPGALHDPTLQQISSRLGTPLTPLSTPVSHNGLSENNAWIFDGGDLELHYICTGETEPWLAGFNSARDAAMGHALTRSVYERALARAQAAQGRHS